MSRRRDNIQERRRGGARAGSGRPTAYQGKKPRTLKLTDEAVAFIDAHGKKVSMTRSDALEDIIQGTGQLMTSIVEAENWLDNHANDPDDEGAQGLLEMLRAALARGRKRP